MTYKYEPMSVSAKTLIRRCILSARENRNKIVFKCVCKGGITDNHQLIPGSAEFEELKFQLSENDADLFSPFDYDSGMEMSIEVLEGAQKTVYPLWFQDSDEDRVYVDYIEDYLRQC